MVLSPDEGRWLAGLLSNAQRIATTEENTSDRDECPDTSDGSPSTASAGDSRRRESHPEDHDASCLMGGQPHAIQGLGYLLASTAAATAPPSSNQLAVDARPLAVTTCGRAACMATEQNWGIHSSDMGRARRGIRPPLRHKRVPEEKDRAAGGRGMQNLEEENERLESVNMWMGRQGRGRHDRAMGLV